jgi:hypothetical protein
MASVINMEENIRCLEILSSPPMVYDPRLERLSSAMRISPRAVVMLSGGHG